MADIAQALGAAFNSAEVEPRADVGELLPAGLYTVEITGAEVKPTKAGNGMLLKLEHTVIDPQDYAKRKLWKSINLRNPNAQAEQIGQAELSALCRAVGIGVLQDSDELMNKIVRARVGIRKGNAQYPDDQNEIKAYESASTATPPAVGKSAPAAPAGKSTPPWQRAKAA